MASGILVLLDDIAAMMDDVALMSKVATEKTAGILGDDLAVNAEKAMGFVSAREIPVIWEITKGSILNKLIILPVAFLLSAFYPPAITTILIFGGFYLAYEGSHKVFSVFVPHKKEHSTADIKNPTPEEIVKFEKKKIKSAITTDFILSIEIIIIALETVPVDSNIINKILVVSFVAMLATVGVYGIVALIVRMDDFGYKLIKMAGDKKSILKTIGGLLVKALPWVIRILSFVGTVALFLVAGGIFTHNIDFFHHLLKTWPAVLKDFSFGLVIGFVVLFLFMVAKAVIKLIKKK
tara:strand:- start:1765 stop:2646 length:882 start_codon:yes stop_codon:yes gene_type:complete